MLAVWSVLRPSGLCRRPEPEHGRRGAPWSAPNMEDEKRRVDVGSWREEFYLSEEDEDEHGGGLRQRKRRAFIF
jgi:hypothetical protein